MKKALITGITGQDGSYLAEFLLDKNYEVHGLRRLPTVFNATQIGLLRAESESVDARVFLHYFNITDSANLIQLIDEIRPDEIYHLASQSNAHLSFDLPEYTCDVTGVSAVRLLNAIRKSGIPAKFYQAGSSEMFGKAREAPQSERTPFYPRSPYATAKVLAHWSTVNYRENYGIFACNGIAFNHESPRRSETFVTRKITRAVARIDAGLQDKLSLGNLDAKRDWGYAKEYVEAMWLMLQQHEPDDYVIATGETHDVREFVELAFAHVGRDWQDHVVIDPHYYRPTEGELLIGDASKARERLGWRAVVKFHDLVQLMMDAEIGALDQVLRREAELNNPHFLYV